MSVTLIAPLYSDICDGYNYGKKFLELPEKIINAVDDHFDGTMVDLNGPLNSDNMWINHYYLLDHREAVVYYAKMLTHEAFSQLVEKGEINSYIEKHFDEIEERLRDRCVLLGYVKNSWHVFV